MNHVMIDLETLSLDSNAAILSIGAVKFDPAGDGITDAIHIGVDLDSAMSLGFDISASTLMWWLQPDRAAARDALLALSRVTVDEALDGFSKWFGERSVPVWGNGAAFDNVVLSNAYALVCLQKPWKYHDDRCYRTLRAMAPEVVAVDVGVAHSALDDARAQAMHLQAIVRAKGLVLL